MSGRRRRVGSIAVACLMLLGSLTVTVLAAPPSAADTFSDPAFSTEVVATVPPYTLVGLAFAPDGRLFVWQKNGVVRVIKNGALLPTPFIDLSAKVNTYDDRGFWGFTFDPDFATNGYVYMSYTFENGSNPSDQSAKTSRLTRAQADPGNPDVALAGSEIVIMGSVGTAPCSAQPPGSDCIPADAGSHTLGSVVFAPDGTMLVGVGDGSDGDALSLRAQDLNSINGKILRINKNATAPTDNPFYDGTNSIKSKVWLYGVRNPFRFALQPGTGDIWFGDVGFNTWEEIDRGVKGGNYGWPCYEGTGQQPYFQTNFPGTCGANLPPSAVKPPYYTYDHSMGSAAIGGPFYGGTAYPQQYQGNFFFGDYSGNYIKRVTFDAAGNPTGVQPFATDVAAPVGMTIGPDGLMYYLSFTTGQIRRIRSNAPQATATATPTYGYSPLSVAFSSAGSGGTGTVSYLWDFGDGTTSTAPNPTHTYSSATPRTFAPKLTVTGSGGVSASYLLSVTVGSTPPTPTITAPVNGTTVIPGQVVSYAGSATDPDDGPLGASALSWTVLLHHNTHVHTFVGGSGGSGSFVVEDHGDIGTFSYEIILTATDSSGLKSSSSVTLPVGSDTTPPTAPTGLTATAAGPSQIGLTWTAATDDAAVTGYRVERCQGAGCTTFAQVGTPSTTTFTDPGLAPATSYGYRVRAVDASGNLGAYSAVATATTPAAPAQPGGLVAGYTFDVGSGTVAVDSSGNGNTGAVNGALWTTGKYGGGLNFNGGGNTVSVPSAASLNVTTAMTLAAWIKPTASQSGWRTIMQKQADAYFLNASNSSGPLIPAAGATTAGGGPVVTGTTASPVNAWTHVAMTYDGTTMRLYVNGTQVATRAATGAIQTTANPLWIGGNSPYGEYFQGVIDDVRVYNRALDGTEIAFIRDNAILPPAPDTSPPTAPSGLTVTPAGTQINLAWTASTDNVGVSGYRVERCQGVGCTTFAEVASPAGTTFSDPGLAPATSYSYRVRAVDAAGNAGAYSAAGSATTGAAADSAPPGVPGGVTATAAGAGRIDLAWTAATDNVGVTEYRIERCSGASCTNFAQVATSTTTGYSNTGLAAATTYRYRVRAADAAGNLGAYSAIASATTPAAADTTNPSAPTGLSATATGPNQVTATWTASTDNVGVTGYRVERCQGSGCSTWAQVGTPTSTTYGDIGLTPATTYRYRVRAVDAAGNLSSYSSAVAVTTPAAPDTTKPTAPAGLTATASGTRIDLAWAASTDNVAVTGYRVERCQGAGCSTFAQVATPTGTTFSDSGLAVSTAYSYRVRAVDAASNASGYSGVASATTGTAAAQPAGLVAGWSFDAGSGTTAVDSSGNGNTGTLNGATWATGKYGGALSFNGTGNTVSVPSATSLNLTAGMTLAAWIRPTASQTSWRTIMQKQPEAYFLDASNGSGTLLPAGGTSSAFVASTTAAPVNTWTHVAMTYDGTTMRFYVNGTQVATKAVTGAIQVTANPLWIGGNSPYGEYFQGLIDDARIYNRALSAAEIAVVRDSPLG